jgi:SAM-dependent methyltransferase
MLRQAPAAERNKEPILQVLRTIVPAEGRVLEIASGTGQHAVHCAAALPGVRWQPSDVDATARASIEAWIAEAGVTNVAPPIELDVHVDPWPVDAMDVVFCANMIHISPASAWPQLLRGARQVLTPGGALALYGPFFVGGQATNSNRAFDADLRRRDPSWGVRELHEVQAHARSLGFTAEAPVAMPANNLIVVLRGPD